jgi:flavin reductase (DIM6/NTAB) family NADH-FMN oxidoreductase RutF
VVDLVEAYKEAMSHWPSGVAIVTSVLGEKNYGMTVSSFTSVSLHPAMVSICIDKRAQMCVLLQNTQKFAVNILDNTQADLAKIFANHEISMSQRFEHADFERSNTESPVLKQCLGWVDCQVHSFHDTGDHVIYVGEVKQAKTLEQKDPVIFYKRGWYGHLTRL